MTPSVKTAAALTLGLKDAERNAPWFVITYIHYYELLLLLSFVIVCQDIFAVILRLRYVKKGHYQLARRVVHDRPTVVEVIV